MFRGICITTVCHRIMNGSNDHLIEKPGAEGRGRQHAALQVCLWVDAVLEEAPCFRLAAAAGPDVPLDGALEAQRGGLK